LLERGADTHARGQMDTPLTQAVRHGHAEIARRLLARGVDPNACDDCGRSALALAAARRRADLAGMLREAGARVGFREAVLLQDADLAGRLLDAGAEIDERDGWGM